MDLDLDQAEQLSNCKTENCSTHAKDMHALFIDDLSEAEAINLKKKLMNDPTPLNYHERTKHILPGNSLLQQNLSRIEEFTVTNKMRIKPPAPLRIQKSSRNNLS